MPRFEVVSMGIAAARQKLQIARERLEIDCAMLGFVKLFRRLAMPRRCADGGDIIRGVLIRLPRLCRALYLPNHAHCAQIMIYLSTVDHL